MKESSIFCEDCEHVSESHLVECKKHQVYLRDHKNSPVKCIPCIKNVYNCIQKGADNETN